MHLFDLSELLPVCGTLRLSDLHAHHIAVLDKQNSLHLYDLNQKSVLRTFKLDQDYTQIPCLVLFADPYIVITQRFGLHAEVFHTQTGQSWHFSRENYHCNVCTYAIGLARQSNRQMLLLHQSQWNRLDITDLATSKLLTERRINYEDKLNYLDYFHSGLTIAPNGQSFLSNGWHWAPVDNIRAGRIDAFLKGYENSTCALDYFNGYNWDRPVVFIDNSTFAITVDNPDAEMLDEDELAHWHAHRLRFYHVNGPRDMHGYLQHFRTLNGDWFAPDNYGEISGSLSYAPHAGLLITCSSKGIYAITPQGETVVQIPLPEPLTWQFSREHEVFYTSTENTLKVALLADFLNL